MQYWGQIRDEFWNIFDREMRDISSLGVVYVQKFAAWYSMRIIYVDLKNEYEYKY